MSSRTFMSTAWGLVERSARRAIYGMALVTVFGLASIVSLRMHLDTAPARRLIAEKASRLVSKVLVGDLRVDRIDSISPTRLIVSRAALVDRLGGTVLVAEGLDVRFRLLDLIRGIFGGSEVHVAVPDVRAERVAVWLTRDNEKGGLTFETVFDMAQSGPRHTPGKPLSVALPRIEVAAASVTTNQKELENSIAKVARLSAGLDFSPAGLILSLRSDDTRIVDVFARDMTGKLRATLRLPGTTRGNLDGEIGGAPFSVAIAWRGARLDASLHAEALDVRSLDGRAPQTALHGDANASIYLGDEVKIDATAALAETRLFGYPIPPTKIRCTYEHETLSTEARFTDPRLATNLSLSMSPAGRIEFATTSSDLDLVALAPYGVIAEGHAALASRGSLDHGHLSATVDASLRSPVVNIVRAETATVRGRVAGSTTHLSELSAELAADAKKFEAGGFAFDRLRVTTKGSGNSQSVSVDGSSERGATLKARTDLSLDGIPVLTNVHLESKRGDSAVQVEAEHVTFDRGFVVRDLSLRSGDGALSGSIASQGEQKLVEFDIDKLDVERVLAAFGASTHGMAGRLDGHAHLEETGANRSGRAALRIRDGAFPPVEDLTASVTAEFDGSVIEAGVEAALAGIGNGRLDTTGSVRGSVFDLHALQEVVGEATLNVADVDLEHASHRWLGETGVALRGHARGAMRLTRTEPDNAPAMSYEVGTQGLTISRSGESGAPASEIRLDFDSVGEVLRAGESRVALNLVDAEGPWIVASMEHSLRPDELVRAGKAGFTRAILDAPLRAHATARRRPLKMFGNGEATFLDGFASANVDITGSARLPEIDASASLTSSEAKEGDRGAAGLDVGLHYSARLERYDLQARTEGKRDRVAMNSSGRFGWLEHGLGRDWSARGEAAVSRLGVDRIGRFVDVPLAGELSGRCSFDVGAGAVDANGEITIDGLGVDDHVIGSGSARMEVVGNRAKASLSVAKDAASIELLGDTGFVLTNDGLHLDPHHGGMLRATVRAFDLASIQPLLRHVVSQLSGALNGRAEIGWGSADSSERQTTLRANATIKDATASLVAGGGLIQNVEVRALADGDGPVRLSFSGAARSRATNINGTATVHFDGPRLKRLDTEVDAHGFPILHDGILLGRATTGSRAPLRVSMVGEHDLQTVDIFIPSIRVELPKSENKTLIALDDDRGVEVVDSPSRSEEQRSGTNTPSNTTLTVRLGNDVRVERGALSVPLSGDVTLGRDGRLTGAITFRKGGVVPVLGQLFRIRRGVVRFESGDPDDGVVAIQASTRAADGTTVDVDVSGTVRSPVVAFHSDPPRSEEEIIAVLLGIQSNTVYKPSRNEARQMGHTAMALAMNRLLRDSALSGLQFGAGETGEGDLVSTVSVRVGSKVWLEGRSVRGSQMSVNQSDRVSGVVDWRFAPTWSLRSQLGEVSGVEVRWSLRY